MFTELKDGVYDVGVTDWGLRHFHGHELSTHRGSSYNAYLIRDEKTVLVDTVWDPFTDGLLENISEVVDPSEIDYVVANHAESDHSGALPRVMEEVPDATVVVSRQGEQNIRGHYHQDWDFSVVSTGDSLDIGQNELLFINAPMLHWPDSMFTYLTGHNILMPNDAFGQHYATAGRFNDEVDQSELFEEALKYYVNILTPFSDLVLRKIDEVLELDLPVDMIAPSHGVIWRENPLQIVEKYQEWARQEPDERAAILYDSMWGGTERMAEAIGEGLKDEGVDYKLLRMSVTDRNDALVEVFRARTVIVGSPTFNKNVLPTMAPLCTELAGMGFKNKQGAAFGSYGWSGESVDRIETHLEEAGIPPVQDGIRCKWQPDADAVEKCRQFGRELAEATLSG
ncbi:MAG: flavodoxin domain-containing protein [Planctomycetota bacterium]